MFRFWGILGGGRRIAARAREDRLDSGGGITEKPVLCKLGGPAKRSRPQEHTMTSPDPSISSGPTLDQPSSGAPAGPFIAPPREGPGTRIGPYRLVQLIGEGGFGS